LRARLRIENLRHFNVLQRLHDSISKASSLKAAEASA
jgi:hypothetical protein